MIQPGSFRILLLWRHPKHYNNKCYIKEALSNKCNMSLCEAIFQYVRIIISLQGNKLSSTNLAVGITLLAIQCFPIKNAFLWLCHWNGLSVLLVHNFIWNIRNTLSATLKKKHWGNKRKKKFLIIFTLQLMSSSVWIFLISKHFNHKG